MIERTSSESETDPNEMDAAELAEAKRYNQISFRCDMFDRLLDLGYLLAVTLLAAVPLDRWLQTYDVLERSRSARLVTMFFIVTIGHIIVSLPLSFFSGHTLEHRFKLSRQTAGRWFGRYLKRHAVTLVVGSLTTLGLYWIIWLTGSWWWIVAAGGYFVLSVLIGQLAPVVILPLFYRIDRLDDDTLNRRLDELCAGTGLAIEGVYRMNMSDETAKANAMLAGLGSTRRVILGDTLLDGFTPNEIDVIFAHEVGHHVHRHVSKLIASGLLYGLVGFWICDQVVAMWVRRVDGSLNYANLPIHTLPLLTLVITLFFMVVEPIQNMVSRRFERQADAYALRRTHKFDAYRTAFMKLAKLNKSDPAPHPWEVFLFHSHPPIAERLEACDRLAGRPT